MMGKRKDISISKLTVSPENARKLAADKQADRELQASIAEHGLFQNLVVSKAAADGTHEIYAGVRRFKAIRALIEQGILSSDYKVPCLIEDDGAKIAQISLAENTARAGMHQVDELEAYHQLHAAKGYDIDDIAAHFGKPKAEVKRILALGSCAPELLDLCRSGEFSVDTLRAFTVTTDHAKQLEAHKSLKASHGRVFEHDVRGLLSEKLIRSTEPIALFVGLNTYKNKGGTFQRDLFSNTTYLTDPDLVQQLADEQLDALADTLEPGWSWIEYQFEHYKSDISIIPKIEGELTAEGTKIKKQIESLQAKLNKLDDADLDDVSWDEADTIEAEIDDLESKLLATGRQFNSEQRGKSGVIIALDRDGNACIYRGLLNSKQVQETTSTESNASSGSSKPEYSQALLTDLNIYKTEIARLAVLKNPDLGSELVHFQMIISLLKRDQYLGTGGALDLGYDCTETETSRQDLEQGAARAEIKKIRDELWSEIPGEWITKAVGADVPAAFAEYLAWSDQLKARLMADVASRSLEISNQVPGLILELTGTHLRSWWHPTAENFFQRIGKDTAMQCGSEILGSEWADDHAKLPRKDLAIRLEEACQPGAAGSLWTPIPMITRRSSAQADAEHETAEDPDQSEAA